MPTPFTHLWIAQNVLAHSALPAVIHTALTQHEPAYLLGSIAPDAKPTPESDREATHFYRYDRPIEDRIWRVMLSRWPQLTPPHDVDHSAFLAGYVAHLAADEYWSLNMLKPHFAHGQWGDDLRWRFYVLHYMLIFMDERDEARLPDTYPDLIHASQPRDWLPFMGDAVLCDWRDYIADQITGDSETLEIFGSRIGTEPAEMRQILDDDARMNQMLWDHVSRDTLHTLETDMIDFAVEQLIAYWAEISEARADC